MPTPDMPPPNAAMDEPADGRADEPRERLKSEELSAMGVAQVLAGSPRNSTTIAWRTGKSNALMDALNKTQQDEMRHRDGLRQCQRCERQRLKHRETPGCRSAAGGGFTRSTITPSKRCEQEDRETGSRSPTSPRQKNGGRN